MNRTTPSSQDAESTRAALIRRLHQVAVLLDRERPPRADTGKQRSSLYAFGHNWLKRPHVFVVVIPGILIPAIALVSLIAYLGSRADVIHVRDYRLGTSYRAPSAPISGAVYLPLSTTTVMGTEGGGVHTLETNTNFWRQYTRGNTNGRLLGDHVGRIASDSVGGLYFLCARKSDGAHEPLYGLCRSTSAMTDWQTLVGLDSFAALAGPNPATLTTVRQHSDRLWLATGGAGIATYDRVSHRWDAFFTTADSGLPSDVVNDLELAPGGSLYAATNQGIARLTEGEWTTFGGAGELAGQEIQQTIWADGNLWYRTSAFGLGVLASDESSHTMIGEGHWDATRDSDIVAAAVNGQALWLASRKRTVARYDATTHSWRGSPKLPENVNISRIRAASQSNILPETLWAATSNGVYSITDQMQRWEWQLEDRDIAEVHLGPAFVVVAAQPAEPSEDDALDIFVRHDDQNKQWRQIQGTARLKPDQMTLIAATIDTENDRILATDGQGILEYDRVRHQWDSGQFAILDPSHTTINDLVWDDSTLWYLADNRALVRYAKGRTGSETVLGAEDEGFTFELNQITSVDRDGKGRLWFATENDGIGVYDPVHHRWTRTAGVEPFTPKSRVDQIICSSGGTWIRTGDRLGFAPTSEAEQPVVQEVPVIPRGVDWIRGSLAAETILIRDRDGRLFQLKAPENELRELVGDALLDLKLEDVEIARLTDTALVVADSSGRLYSYDLNTHSWTHHWSCQPDGSSPCCAEMSGIAGRVWVRTTGGKLYEFTDTLATVEGPSDVRQLSCDATQCLALAGSGAVWRAPADGTWRQILNETIDGNAPAGDDLAGGPYLPVGDDLLLATSKAKHLWRFDWKNQTWHPQIRNGRANQVDGVVALAETAGASWAQTMSGEVLRESSSVANQWVTVEQKNVKHMRASSAGLSIVFSNGASQVYSEQKHVQVLAAAGPGALQADVRDAAIVGNRVYVATTKGTASLGTDLLAWTEIKTTGPAEPSRFLWSVNADVPWLLAAHSGHTYVYRLARGRRAWEPALTGDPDATEVPVRHAHLVKPARGNGSQVCAVTDSGRVWLVDSGGGEPEELLAPVPLGFRPSGFAAVEYFQDVYYVAFKGAVGQARPSATYDPASRQWKLLEIRGVEQFVRDGQRLWAKSQDGRLWLWADDRFKETLDNVNGRVCTAGDSILVATDTHELIRIRPDHKESIQGPAAPEHPIEQVVAAGSVVSKDGTRFLLLSDGGSLWAYDPNHHRWSRSDLDVRQIALSGSDTLLVTEQGQLERASTTSGQVDVRPIAGVDGDVVAVSADESSADLYVTRHRDGRVMAHTDGNTTSLVGAAWGFDPGAKVRDVLPIDNELWVAVADNAMARYDPTRAEWSSIGADAPHDVEQFFDTGFSIYLRTAAGELHKRANGKWRRVAERVKQCRVWGDALVVNVDGSEHGKPTWRIMGEARTPTFHQPDSGPPASSIRHFVAIGQSIFAVAKVQDQENVYRYDIPEHRWEIIHENVHAAAARDDPPTIAIVVDEGTRVISYRRDADVARVRTDEPVHKLRWYEGSLWALGESGAIYKIEGDHSVQAEGQNENSLPFSQSEIPAPEDGIPGTLPISFLVNSIEVAGTYRRGMLDIDVTTDVGIVRDRVYRATEGGLFVQTFDDQITGFFRMEGGVTQIRPDDSDECILIHGNEDRTTDSAWFRVCGSEMITKLAAADASTIDPPTRVVRWQGRAWNVAITDRGAKFELSPAKGDRTVGAKDEGPWIFHARNGRFQRHTVRDAAVVDSSVWLLTAAGPVFLKDFRNGGDALLHRIIGHVDGTGLDRIAHKGRRLLASNADGKWVQLGQDGDATPDDTLRDSRIDAPFFSGMEWRVSRNGNIVKVERRRDDHWVDLGFDPKAGMETDAITAIATTHPDRVFVLSGRTLTKRNLEDGSITYFDDQVLPRDVLGKSANALVPGPEHSLWARFGAEDRWWQFDVPSGAFNKPNVENTRAFQESQIQLCTRGPMRWTKSNGPDVQIEFALPNGKWLTAHLGERGAMDADTIYDALPTDDGLWLATETGLQLLDRKQLTLQTAYTENEFRGQTELALVDNRLFAKNRTGSTYEYDGGTWKAVDMNAWPPVEPQETRLAYLGVSAGSGESVDFTMIGADEKKRTVTLSGDGRFEYQQALDMVVVENRIVVLSKAGLWFTQLHGDKKVQGFVPLSAEQAQSGELQIRENGTCTAVFSDGDAIELTRNGQWRSVEEPPTAEWVVESSNRWQVRQTDTDQQLLYIAFNNEDYSAVDTGGQAGSGFAWQHARQILSGPDGGWWSRHAVGVSRVSSDGTPKMIFRQFGTAVDSPNNLERVGDIIIVRTDQGWLALGADEWTPFSNAKEQRAERDATLLNDRGWTWIRRDGSVKILRTFGDTVLPVDWEDGRFSHDAILDAVVTDRGAVLATEAGLLRMNLERNEGAVDAAIDANGHPWTDLYFDLVTGDVVGKQQEQWQQVELQGAKRLATRRFDTPDTKEIIRRMTSWFADETWHVSREGMWRNDTPVRMERNGFAHDQWRAFVIHGGHLWAATAGGVAQFDLTAPVPTMVNLALADRSDLEDVATQNGVGQVFCPAGEWVEQANGQWVKVDGSEALGARTLLQTDRWTWLRNSGRLEIKLRSETVDDTRDDGQRSGGVFAEDFVRCLVSREDVLWQGTGDGILRVDVETGHRYWYRRGWKNGTQESLGAITRFIVSQSDLWAEDENGRFWQLTHGTSAKWEFLDPETLSKDDLFPPEAETDFVVIMRSTGDDKVKLAHSNAGGDCTEPMLKNGRFRFDNVRSFALYDGACYLATPVGIVVLDATTGRHRHTFCSANIENESVPLVPEEVFVHSAEGSLCAVDKDERVYILAPERDAFVYSPVDQEWKDTAQILVDDDFWRWNRWQGKAGARLHKAPPNVAGWRLFDNGRFSFDAVRDIRIDGDVLWMSTAGGMARYRLPEMTLERLETLQTGGDPRDPSHLLEPGLFVSRDRLQVERLRQTKSRASMGFYAFSGGEWRWVKELDPSIAELRVEGLDDIWVVRPDAAGSGLQIEHVDQYGNRTNEPATVPAQRWDQLLAGFANRNGLWLCTTDGLYRIRR